MKSSIIPTVGRIVLCFVTSKKGRHVLPGIIVRVFDGDPKLCNVKVFGDYGNTGFDTKELYSAEIQDPGVVGHDANDEWCEWMPYQKGQAAMTEAIAKKAGMEVAV